MKVGILAGGLGSRLTEEAEVQPRQRVELGPSGSRHGPGLASARAFVLTRNEAMSILLQTGYALILWRMW